MSLGAHTPESREVDAWDMLQEWNEGQMMVRHEASRGRGGGGADLVKVLPAGRGDRGTYAELICVRLGGDPDNGQPGALHCMPCIANITQISKIQAAQVISVLILWVRMHHQSDRPARSN